MRAELGFPNFKKGVVVCHGWLWCMAAGEPCASTSGMSSLWEVMSRCVWFGQFCEVCDGCQFEWVGEMAHGMLAVVHAGNREVISVWVQVMVCVC